MDIYLNNINLLNKGERMNKSLEFTQIADNRFNENENTLISRDKEIKIALAKLSGVTLVKEGEIRKLNFSDNIIQWRKNYLIQKTKQTTWNKIYGTISNIKAVPYYLV